MPDGNDRLEAGHATEHSPACPPTQTNNLKEFDDDGIDMDKSNALYQAVFEDSDYDYGEDSLYEYAVNKQLSESSVCRAVPGNDWATARPQGGSRFHGCQHQVRLSTQCAMSLPE
jgi:hypothetical protein